MLLQKLEALGIEEGMLEKLRNLSVGLKDDEFLANWGDPGLVNRIYESEVVMHMQHMLGGIPKPYQKDDITAAFIVSVKMICEAYDIGNAYFIPQLADDVKILNKIEREFLNKIDFNLPSTKDVFVGSVEYLAEELTEINCRVQAKIVFKRRHLDAGDIKFLQGTMDRLHQFSAYYKGDDASEIKQKVVDLEKAFSDLKDNFLSLSSNKRWEFTLAFFSKVKVLIPIFAKLLFGGLKEDVKAYEDRDIVEKKFEELSVRSSIR